MSLVKNLVKNRDSDELNEGDDGLLDMAQFGGPAKVRAQPNIESSTFIFCLVPMYLLINPLNIVLYINLLQSLLSFSASVCDSGELIQSRAAFVYDQNKSLRQWRHFDWRKERPLRSFSTTIPRAHHLMRASDYPDSSHGSFETQVHDR